MTTLEIAAFDLASALAAGAAGADRIELCADAPGGGTTPSLGAVEEARARLGVPVAAMLRARPGPFVFDAAEHAAMRRDAAHLARAGADGLVFGALRPDGTVDEGALRAVVALAGGRPVAFHRAFDAARDPFEALDALVRCGVARVLTSGGPGGAAENQPALAALVRRAAGALVVMPGGGVRAGNVRALVAATGAREVHSAARAPSGLAVDAAEVRRLRAALDAAGEGRPA